MAFGYRIQLKPYIYNPQELPEPADDKEHAAELAAFLKAHQVNPKRAIPSVLCNSQLGGKITQTSQGVQMLPPDGFSFYELWCVADQIRRADGPVVDLIEADYERLKDRIQQVANLHFTDKEGELVRRVMTAEKIELVGKETKE
jgi:hypothetical protein